MNLKMHTKAWATDTIRAGILWAIKIVAGDVLPLTMLPNLQAWGVATMHAAVAAALVIATGASCIPMVPAMLCAMVPEATPAAANRIGSFPAYDLGDLDPSQQQ
jgi:hypothetical protein